jgi:small multidrug resistance pump
MKMYGWLFLILAIIFEILGTTSMKLSDGFTKTIPSLLLFVFYGISFTFFTYSLKTMEVSIAYAVWAGIGTAIISLIGFLYFKEPVTALKLISIAAIIAGVVGLRLSGIE